jgi:hypothetical protein
VQYIMYLCLCGVVTWLWLWWNSLL